MSGGLPGSKLRAFETAPSAPVMGDLHWASEGSESKLLFRQRNKKFVAARTHSSGNAALKTRSGESAGSRRGFAFSATAPAHTQG
jgi:hypothetical protein